MVDEILHIFPYYLLDAFAENPVFNSNGYTQYRHIMIELLICI